MPAFIPVAEPDLAGNEKKYVLDCLESTWISSLGTYIERFEDEFASFCHAQYGVSTSNGTVALQLALAALGIGKGDEVIVPDLTFVATANAVTYVGATPVFVDVDEATWQIDVEQLRKRVTPRTKAIIPVHLYGHPCDMDPIMELARQHDLKVIEDAAEAHGARYKGKPVGSMGDVGCFSFYGNKLITTGEGGMCVTGDAALADRMRFLKDHGMSAEKRYWHPEIGFNFRMTNVQAAIGVAQLERIERTLDIRRRHSLLYRSLLKGVTGIALQPRAAWAEPVPWLHSILVGESFRVRRAVLMAELKSVHIDSRPFFWPLHALPPYLSQEEFPVASFLSQAGMNLPSSTKLSEEDIRRVCGVIAGA